MCLLVGPGQEADCPQALALLAAVPGAGGVLADKAYDADYLRAAIAQLGAEAVIPSMRHRRVQHPLNRPAYRRRNQIERFFGRLKQFRRLATRYDKTATSFLGMLHFISAIIWVR